MARLQYNYVRPPSLTVVRLVNGNEVRYCADNIHGLVEAGVPHLGFVCSGSHVSFPATEIVGIDLFPESGHCNTCDRQHDARVID